MKIFWVSFCEAWSGPRAGLFFLLVVFFAIGMALYASLIMRLDLAGVFFGVAAWFRHDLNSIIERLSDD